MIQQIANQKLECEKIQSQIEEYIQWQDSNARKKANIPQVDKFHKELLFTEWKTQISRE